MIQLLFFSLMFFGLDLWAAPQPATTSSILTDPEKGQSFRAFGFKLALEKSQWRPLQKESDGIFPEIQFTPRQAAAPGSKAQITMRMDELTRPQRIEAYAKKWMREYPQYGFEVLGTKTFAHSGGQGLVVDLLHRPNNKQSRQIVLLKDQKVVILTCSNERSKFQEVLTECNQMVKNFNWLESKK